MSDTMIVKFSPNEKGNPPGKLAEAELHFPDGPLAGLKLIGFSVWERRGAPGRNVTFPARQYTINSERRSFALLRPIMDPDASTRIRDRILEAFAEYEAQEAQPVAVPKETQVARDRLAHLPDTRTIRS